MTDLLEGLRVIQMGHVAAIPTAGALLADWGAEVIKLEPLDGEVGRLPGRSYGVSREVDLNGQVVNYIFELHNRSQKGIAVDLKKPAGKEAILKLIEKTDIFMTNYEVGALKKLGMDYSSLSRVNPRLIYGFLTGYGTQGPDKDERGFDLTAAWARSGGQYMAAPPSAPPSERQTPPATGTGPRAVPSPRSESHTPAPPPLRKRKLAAWPRSERPPTTAS